MKEMSNRVRKTIQRKKYIEVVKTLNEKKANLELSKKIGNVENNDIDAHIAEINYTIGKYEELIDRLN